VPIVTPIQTHFAGGEISPLLDGRVDAERRKSSLGLCKNWLPTLAGPLMRRPASIYVGGIKGNGRARLVPFQFSTTQSYMLEFGPSYIRFWTNYGLVLSGGTPYEVATTYSSINANDIFEIKFTQSADVIYITHPNHPPRKLQRFGATDWRLDTISFQDGPYMPLISTGLQGGMGGASATVSATSGQVSLSYGTFFAIVGTAAGTSGRVRITLGAGATTNKLVNGQMYRVEQVQGTVEANGTWAVQIIDGTHLDLIGSTFVNAFVVAGAPQLDPAPFIEHTFSTVRVQGTAAGTAGVVRLTVPDSSIFGTINKMYHVEGVGGTAAANGTWVIAIVDATHIELVGSVYAGAYVANTGTITLAISIGRLIRMKAHLGNWGWGKVIFVNNPYTLVVDITGTLGNVNLDDIRLGAWSSNTGYPSTVTFNQDRLCFDGPFPGDPQRLDGSSVSDYENFAPTLADGTVTDANAYSFDLTSNDVNDTAWLTADDKGLLTGSVSAEWVLRPTSLGQAITPTNVSAAKTTRWGSEPNVPVATVGRAAIFVQRGGRRIREMHYFFDIDSYRATDLTELAEHITGSGVIDMAHQALPISLIWVVRADGTLLCMTYDRDSQQLRTGWAQHALGGQSDAAGNPPIVESIGVISSPDGTQDDVWMVVRRYVNGSTVRYMEYLAKIFEGVDLQKDAKHLDCGATYDNPISISAVTIAATPQVTTSTNHGLTTGDTVQFDTVVGLTIGTANALNTKRTLVTVLNATQFTLDSISTVGATAYVGSGKVRKMVTTISGLTYLENETLYGWADGADTGPLVVSAGGVVTLPFKAAVVHLGYSADSDGQMLRLEAGSRSGTSIGKTRRTHRLGLLVYRSLGLKIGQSFDQLDPVEFRTSGVAKAGYAPDLVSGIHSHTVEFDYDYDNLICFRVSGGTPCTLLSVMPQLETQDRA
jgi:hypothetical protein